ncbi:MAG TPA: hypothetical protein DDY38_06470, partial [Firmicutes bacterium]|nr:hypothetical protein [Bacillota bacterium]
NQNYNNTPPGNARRGIYVKLRKNILREYIHPNTLPYGHWYMLVSLKIVLSPIWATTRLTPGSISPAAIIRVLPSIKMES